MPRHATSVGVLHYAEHGPPDAPVLVLLHAFPLSSRIFDDFIDALGSQVRAVTLDLPGLGGSTAYGEPSVAAMAGGVTEVLDHLGVARCVVLGISTGGYVALELATERPDLLQGLVLGSTTTRVGPPDVPEERLALAERLERTRDLSLLHDTVDEGLGPTARRARPELRDLLLDVIDGSDPDGVAWVARALAARRDTSSVLAGVETPVLLLFGEEDEATPPARGREMAGLCGDGPGVVVLAATGHLTVLERPVETSALVTSFVLEV